MALQSELFRGDSKLESAAVSDPAHIVPGSRGDHVRKIQRALIQLDGAAIDTDGVYGPATAAAVLAYKKKRNIVNRSRQAEADNIVGIMTMDSLDNEMLKQEAVPRTPVQIRPLSVSSVRPARSPALLDAVNRSQPPRFDDAPASSAFDAPRILPLPTFPNFLPAPNSGPNVVLEMRRNSVGSFEIVGGAPGEVVIGDTAIAQIIGVSPSNRAPVLLDPQRFDIRSGKTLGRTTITATSLGTTASIEVVVKTFFTPPRFVPGVNHAHRPSGKYKDVQANPNNGPGEFSAPLATACKIMGPSLLVATAKATMFLTKPIALKHLNFYLSEGKGADFVENDNIKDWLTRDSGIRRRLKREIFPRGSRPKGEGHFLFDQIDYAVEDFKFAFGGIDRVDFEVDFSQDTVRVWFQDRYEWHPVYPFYTFQGPTAEFPESGDEVRETNCLHAALVELKSNGAADFWMKGEAEVALSLIAKS